MDIFLIALVFASGLAAIVDFLTYKIPNAILLFLLALFLAKVGLFQTPRDLLWPLSFFAIALVVGYGLFYFRILGAGDAKFIAVAVLWMTPINVVLFLVLMSLSGAVLGILYLLAGRQIEQVRRLSLAKMQGIPWLGPYLASKTDSVDAFLENNKKMKGPLPYGVAVFSGMLLTLYFHAQGVR